MNAHDLVFEKEMAVLVNRLDTLSMVRVGKSKVLFMVARPTIDISRVLSGEKIHASLVDVLRVDVTFESLWPVIETSLCVIAVRVQGD